MKTQSFHDEMSLVEAAEFLAKEAFQRGLIPSFAVRHYLDSAQFFIPDEEDSEALTPEQAYLRLKRLIENAA